MRLILTLLASSALLAACGGGSSGSSNAALEGAVAPVTTQAALTPGNYVAVAQETLSSSAYLTTAANLATGAQVSDSDVLIRFGQAQATQLSRWFSTAPVNAVGVVQSQTEACAGGGTLTIAENDLNGNRNVDPGDSATLTASNCAFEGQVLNGQLVATVRSISGEPGIAPYSLSLSMAFKDLVAQSAAVRSVGNGTLVLDLNARALNDQSVALSTSSFEVATAYSSTSYSKALKNYQTSTTLAPSGLGATYTTAVKGTLISSAFESKFIDIATPVPFVRTGSQAYPASGQLIITGAAGGKVRVTATSASALFIELDADGNGTYEAATSKGWSEML